ncbi:hypothetical protein ACLESO_52595 [Pyxidicoccus sp. 3LG]
MVKQDVMTQGDEGPVENINPKDPPPEVIKGLAAQPYSAKMSVPASPSVDVSSDEGGA